MPSWSAVQSKLLDQARAVRFKTIRRHNLRAACHSSAHEIWAGAVDEEITFWRKWFATKGGPWPQDFKFRFDPESSLQESVAKHLTDVGPSVRLLDVGSGPLTMIGKRWPGHDLEITPVDALADQYDALLAEFSLTPPVRTRKCDTEHLSDEFAPDTFDVAYCRNALDHHYQPLDAIHQMVTVVKPGGTVLLQHSVNEAEREAYSGMHQWNFDWRDGDCVIWRPGKEWSLQSEFAGQATVSGGKEQEVVTAKLTKAT